MPILSLQTLLIPRMSGNSDHRRVASNGLKQLIGKPLLASKLISGTRTKNQERYAFAWLGQRGGDRVDVGLCPGLILLRPLCSGFHRGSSCFRFLVRIGLCLMNSGSLGTGFMKHLASTLLITNLFIQSVKKPCTSHCLIPSCPCLCPSLFTCLVCLGTFLRFPLVMPIMSFWWQYTHFCCSDTVFCHRRRSTEATLYFPGHALHEKGLQRQKCARPLVSSQNEGRFLSRG